MPLGLIAARTAVHPASIYPDSAILGDHVAEFEGADKLKHGDKVAMDGGMKFKSKNVVLYHHTKGSVK